MSLTLFCPDHLSSSLRPNSGDILSVEEAVHSFRRTIMPSSTMQWFDVSSLLCCLGHSFVCSSNTLFRFLDLQRRLLYLFVPLLNLCTRSALLALSSGRTCARTVCRIVCSVRVFNNRLSRTNDACSWVVLFTAPSTWASSLDRATHLVHETITLRPAKYVWRTFRTHGGAPSLGCAKPDLPSRPTTQELGKPPLVTSRRSPSSSPPSFVLFLAPSHTSPPSPPEPAAHCPVLSFTFAFCPRLVVAFEGAPRSSPSPPRGLPLRRCSRSGSSVSWSPRAGFAWPSALPGLVVLTVGLVRPGHSRPSLVSAPSVCSAPGLGGLCSVCWRLLPELLLETSP